MPVQTWLNTGVATLPIFLLPVLGSSFALYLPMNSLPYKSANKHILNSAIAQAVLDYDVEYLKGHLCDELKFGMSKIIMSNLEVEE